MKQYKCDICGREQDHRPAGEVTFDPDDRVENTYQRRRPDGQEIVTEMDLWATNVAYSLSRWVAGFREQGFPDLDHVASLVAVLQRKMRPLDDQYDRIDSLPFTAVVSLEVYREILGIDSPVHLQGHLRRQLADGFRVHEFFGLSEIPHPNTG